MALKDKLRKAGIGLGFASLALIPGCFFQVAIYQGRANLVINTEPQGARVYEMPGRYLGTTPLENFGYAVDDNNRASGLLETREFVFVKEGYLPAKRQFQLQIRKGHYTHEDILPHTYYESLSYHELLILERDPNAPNVPNVQYNHTTIRQEESGLDQSLKLGELMLIIKALSPVH